MSIIYGPSFVMNLLPVHIYHSNYGMMLMKSQAYDTTSPIANDMRLITQHKLVLEHVTMLYCMQK